MPVEKAASVHTTIQSTILGAVKTGIVAGAKTADASCSTGDFLVHYVYQIKVTAKKITIDTDKGTGVDFTQALLKDATTPTFQEGVSGTVAGAAGKTVSIVSDDATGSGLVTVQCVAGATATVAVA